MLNRRVASILAIAIVLVSIGSYLFYSRYETSISERYANAWLLVDNQWVLDHLDDPSLRIIDVRAKDQYDQGHVENAVNLYFDDLRTTVDGIRNVAPKESVELMLGELGIAQDAAVVIYDEGDSLDASLVFWALEYYGHKDVRIMNGGWSKWTSEGNPSTNLTATYDRTVYKATVRPELLATRNYILENLENPRVLFLDARSELEYKGIDLRAKRGGHIPGAVNIEWKRNLSPDGTFRSAEDLLKMYDAAGLTNNKEVVTYCQSGHRAALSYFTMRLLGYEARMYDSSWEEWGNRDDTPIE